MPESPEDDEDLHARLKTIPTTCGGKQNSLAGPYHLQRVNEKLRREPVEDFRIDFEDGYGNRPDAEEDGHAVAAAAKSPKAS